MLKKFVSKSILFAVFLSVTLVAAGCGRTIVQPLDSAAGGEPGGDANSVTYVGAVIPQSEIQITPKTSGVVTLVNADVGYSVQAGDVLCRVDDTDARLQVQLAQAQYDAATTALSNLKNGTTVQTANQLSQAVDKAKLDVSAAQKNYDTAKANFDAHTTVNQAKLALDAATTAYNNAVSIAGSGMSVTQAQTEYNDALIAFNTVKQQFDAGLADQAALDAAQAVLSAAQLNLAAAQTAQQTVAVAKNQMNIAQQAYDSAVLNEQSALNAAKSALDNANLELTTAQTNYNLMVNVLNPGNIDYTQTAVDAAKAGLDLAQRQLENTTITAPVSGSISVRNVQTGMVISPASQLFTLVDLTSADITLKVTESDIGSMTVGKAVSISIQNTDINDKQGTISSVSPSADLQNGMYSVKIVVNNSDGALKGGMFANVTVAK